MSANPNADGRGNLNGSPAARAIKFNQEKTAHSNMLKNESAVQKNTAAQKVSTASQARNKKFNADFEAMKQHSPVHGALNKKQGWFGKHP
jgi:hypothetical protein